jgi:hypothetical protein
MSKTHIITRSIDCWGRWYRLGTVSLGVKSHSIARKTDGVISGCLMVAHLGSIYDPHWVSEPTPWVASGASISRCDAARILREWRAAVQREAEKKQQKKEVAA